MGKSMKLLLLEDDVKICEEFKEIVKKKDKVTIDKITNSSEVAINAIKKFSFNGIIVDLELNYGTGSGFEFLNELHKMNLDPKPIVVVNTNIISDIVYDKIHSGLADVIFYKKQEDYSVERVIDTIISLMDNKYEEKVIVYSEEEKDKMLEDLINSELDLVGINYKLKGRDYIFESILELIKDENCDNVFQIVGSKYKLQTSSISKAIQTAINEAWRTSAIEDLREHYTAKINYKTGVPTPIEFVYYYVEKIKKIMNT